MTLVWSSPNVKGDEDGSRAKFNRDGSDPVKMNERTCLNTNRLGFSLAADEFFGVERRLFLLELGLLSDRDEDGKVVFRVLPPCTFFIHRLRSICEESTMHASIKKRDPATYLYICVELEEQTVNGGVRWQMAKAISMALQRGFCHVDGVEDASQIVQMQIAFRFTC